MSGVNTIVFQTAASEANFKKKTHWPNKLAKLETGGTFTPDDQTVKSTFFFNKKMYQAVFFN